MDDPNDLNLCPCGSGEISHPLYDARGIYCCKVCNVCEDEKRSHYRADIFEDSNYECDEQIEPLD